MPTGIPCCKDCQAGTIDRDRFMALCPPNSRFAEVLWLRLCDESCWSLREIGARMGTAKEIVRRLEDKGIRFLRRSRPHRQELSEIAPHGTRLHHVVLGCDPGNSCEKGA